MTTASQVVCSSHWALLSLSLFIFKGCSSPVGQYGLCWPSWYQALASLLPNTLAHTDMSGCSLSEKSVQKMQPVVYLYA